MRIRHLLRLAVIAAALCLPATAAADVQHTVTSGESLSSVAAADGLSVSELAAANGMSPDAQLQTGAELAIPPQGASTSTDATSATTASTSSGTSEPVAATSSTASGGGYVVQPGDTLSEIAQRSGVGLDSLAAANGMSPSDLLLAGRTITVSGSSSASSGGSTEPSSSVTSGPGAQPTSETVSSTDVGSIAAQDGVSPSLAQAIAYQESGFNNGEVSKTGATGVMQIEPGTWRYIQSHLGGSALSSASATDNVRGGVTLLHSLLDQTGGDTAQAVAGYYQGLRSVQRHGMYRDTQKYVDNVLALQHRFGG